MPIQNYSYDGISRYNQNYSLYYMINYSQPSLEALSYYYTLYPFADEKYGHNHYGWTGAMEHQTLTSISPGFNTEYVIAHELGHQWAGDLVTCANFHHMWLNEGFASYSEALYFKYHYGDGYYKSWLNGQKHLDVGTPYVEDLVNDDMFDNQTVYDKGSWVVYMLHMVMGDSLFLEAMDNYFHDPDLEYGTAFTSDLEEACEEIYDSQMDWFFDQWVYFPGNPDYVYSYQYEADTIEGGYDLYLLLRQAQEWTVFTMPVDIEIQGSGYDTAFTVFNNQRGQVWEIDVPNPPTSIQIDPDEKILRTVSYDPEFALGILATKQVDTAVIGVPYLAEYGVVGGLPDYTWNKITGQFPYGLSLADSSYKAVLSGTPIWTSDYHFTLEVLDSDEPPLADTMSFTIVVIEGPEPPGIPTLLSPSNGSTINDSTPLLSWSATAGFGGTYNLEYSEDISFSGKTAVTGLTSTNYEIPSPLSDGVWYWHVEAINSSQIPSGYQPSPFSFTLDTSPQLRGDCNGDENINISDAVYIINYAFSGGPAPNPLEAGDVNCDEAVNVSDAVYLINYAFA